MLKATADIAASARVTRASSVDRLLEKELAAGMPIRSRTSPPKKREAPVAVLASILRLSGFIMIKPRTPLRDARMKHRPPNKT